MLEGVHDFKQMLLGAQLKATINRLEVLKILKQADKELTILDILYHDVTGTKKLSIATVYQVLKRFEQAGLVSKFKLNQGQALYALKKEKQTLRLYCQHCGSVDSVQDDAMDGELKRLLQKYGAESYKLVLHTKACLGCTSR